MRKKRITIVTNAYPLPVSFSKLEEDSLYMAYADIMAKVRIPTEKSRNKCMRSNSVH